MSAQHVDEFTASFERVALDAAYESDLPSAVMAQLTAAISLKRIADAMDGPNVEGFLNQLLDIAYKAGLNFRGQA